MAEHLAQNFVNLSYRGLGSHSRAKLCLHHSKGRLGVRSLVVVLQERPLVEVVVVPSPVPKAIIAPMTLGANRRFPERDVGYPTNCLNRLMVALGSEVDPGNWTGG